MTESYVEKLLKLSEPELGTFTGPSNYPNYIPPQLRYQHSALLALKNGFYVFDSALHIYPAGILTIPGEISIEDWNRPTLWKDTFKGKADKCHCFAEDLFGEQYAFTDKEIVCFDPETGESFPIADSLEEWAQKILEEPGVRTGSELAKAWQQEQGPLPPGMRLVPTTPFVLGGDYSVDNLYQSEAVAAMRRRGRQAQMIKELPEGSKLLFDTDDY